MLKNSGQCRESDKRDGVSPCGLRPDLQAVRTGIGAAIRTIHADVLQEDVPKRIAELLRQLDEQKDAGRV
jgi:Anti-sigma factor NepR